MRKFIFFIVFLLLVGVIGANEIEDKVDEKVIEELEEEDTVEVIVVLKEEPGKVGSTVVSGSKDGVMNSLNKDEFDKKRDFSSFNGFGGEISEEGLTKLQNDPAVKKIEYLYPVHAFLQDSIPLVNATLVQNLQISGVDLRGKDQTICVIDTGIDYTHEDLGGCLGDGCKVIGGYDFVNSNEDPMDDNGHGTHCAGIIASNNSGAPGVGQDIKLVALKVLDKDGVGSPLDTVSAVEWCTDNSSLYNITVISMSLGDGLNYTSYCDDTESSYASAINGAVAKNITVVIAAGNSGNYSAISAPACIENSTTVSSTDKNDDIASYSSRGINLTDLFAPGSFINSTVPLESSCTGSLLYENCDDSGYSELSGTSMATPHVAGVIALVKQYALLELNKILSEIEIKEALNNSGVGIYDSDSDYTYSRIDVYETIFDLDTVAPRIIINLDNNTLEYNQTNLTIDISYVDAFLDSSSANVSLPNGTLLSTFIDNLNLTTDNLTFLGTYTINAWANDTNGNENSAMNSFLVRDTAGLSSDSFIFNTVNDSNYSGTEFIEFNVSIGSKYNLDNVTFSHNFTDWNLNETFDLDVNEVELIFNSTFNEGIYLWNLEACDVNNYCVNSGNKTLYVDLSEPEVNLISPLNGTSLYSNSVTFNYNVSDYGINNCQLIIDSELNETDSPVVTGATESITITLQNGNYTWDMNCTDKVSNTNGTLEYWNITVCQPYWNCTDWGSCQSDDAKTRTCTDNNNCGTDTDKPSESTSCTYDDGSSNNNNNDGGSDSSSTSTTTNTQTQSSFKFSVNAGATKKYTISKDVGISGLNLEFKNAVSNAEIIVTKQDAKPSSVTAVSNVYKYIKISTNLMESDLKEAKIEFKVEKSWININALGRSTNVYLNRFKDGKWNKLETLTAGEDGIYQKFIAITPGFSYFAISANKDIISTTGNVVSTTSVEETNETIEESSEIIESSEEKKTMLEQFTGFANIVVGGVTSIYSLIGLGVLVVLLVGFLVLRHKKKISRVKGVKFKKVNFKWFLSLVLFNIFKRRDKVKGGDWQDVAAEKKEMKRKGYNHEFEIKEKYGAGVEAKEEGKKEGFFSKLKNLFKKKEEKAGIKEEKTVAKKVEKQAPIEEKEGFFSKLLKKFKGKKKPTQNFELK